MSRYAFISTPFYRKSHKVLAVSQFSDAIEELRGGRPVLLHDFNSRENETDIAIAAEKVTPTHIRRMRTQAGGLICVALRHDLGRSISLPLMTELLEARDTTNHNLGELCSGENPYGGTSSFSISVNHRETFTGITDRDRALTIRKLAGLLGQIREGKSDLGLRFISEFRSPGHVNLLLASKGLLSNRLGHTELSVYLAEVAGITPVVAICEMLDNNSFGALRPEDARKFATENGIPFLEGKEVLQHYLPLSRST